LISDLEIMVQVKNGDINKLSILFNRYKNQLFGYFFRNSSDQILSEDMVQTVFMRILKYRKRFRGEGKFTSWMYNIAHNVLYDEKFKKGSRTETVTLDENILTDSQVDENILTSPENVQILNKALQSLHQEQRELLVMSKYQNLKYREIGEILNCTEANVKVKVFRAMISLKDQFHKLEGDL